MNGNGIEAYLRFSRDEERDRRRTMAEKIGLGEEILLTLARENDQPITREQITTELLSGGSLNERRGLLAILDRCRAGATHTVIVFDVDRLTRDVADLQTIMRAFFRGSVTLITHRDTYRFDKHFDTTYLQILAILGEKERRSFSIRRRAANDQRTRSGRWSQGLTPYGYRWDKDGKVFRVVSDEYAVVEEILRRSWDCGAERIARDLRERGVRPPGQGKRVDASPVWTSVAVLNIASNPFYTGHTVRRNENDREGRTNALPPSQWVWSEQPVAVESADGLGPFPVSRPDWEALQEVRLGRRRAAPTAGLLSGLLRCPAGRPMWKTQSSYKCDCKLRGDAHAPESVLRQRIEPAVWSVVWGALDAAIDIPRVEWMGREDSCEQLQREALRLGRQAREREETLQDLLRRGGYYRSLPYYRAVGPDGRNNFDREMETVAAEVEDLTTRASAAEQRARIASLRPSGSRRDSLAILGALRAGIQEAPVEEQHKLLRTVVQRVDLLAPPAGRKTAAAARVTWWDLVEDGVRSAEVAMAYRPGRGT